MPNCIPAIVKCIVQPGDGIAGLIRGIDRAKKSIEIVIFRLNRREIERALASAVKRGVHVHALIAYTNRGGEQSLRDLELRLLGAGVTVARTDSDLIRYHGKLMIVDARELYVLAFNFTYLDTERSRTFGIVTTNRKHVQEAIKLFAADAQRQPYSPSIPTFVVSPANARKQLATFIRGAKKELLIYDPEISDPAMIRLLESRVRAGVAVKIIGRLAAHKGILSEAHPSPIRLHTRSIIRDGTWAFVGSQSLRAPELDSRREVGIIFHDPKVVGRLASTFRDDWEAKGGSVATATASAGEVAQKEAASAAKVARKVAKAIARELSPVTPVVETTVREFAAAPVVSLNGPEIEDTVKSAVQDAVRQVVRDFVEEAVEGRNGAAGT